MNPFNKLSQNEFPIVVLTGGPGGGKTTLMRELRAADPDCRRWVLVPEAAPFLFQAGLNAREKRFQLAVVRLQMALEEACMLTGSAGSVLVCHRGTLDALAYWLCAGWEESDFFIITGMSREEHLSRYPGIIHLQTTAIGAQAHYRRWPDAHRSETLEQAVTVDNLCARAWAVHCRYVTIENPGREWAGKQREACATLGAWLANRDAEMIGDRECSGGH